MTAPAATAATAIVIIEPEKGIVRLPDRRRSFPPSRSHLGSCCKRHVVPGKQGFAAGRAILARLDADLMAARALLEAQIPRVWQNPERAAGGGAAPRGVRKQEAGSQAS